MFYEAQNKTRTCKMSYWEMVMFSFIRIPKSGSTSIMASIAKINFAQHTPNFEMRHLTVEEIKKDGQEHNFYTVIRNPLQQYISMYYQAKGFVEQNLDFSDTPQPMLEAFIDHMKVVRETDSLEEYLLNAPQNAFLGKYLSGMSPTDLACVGHIDFMDETRYLFNKVVGLPVVPVWLKRNPLREKDIYEVASSVGFKFSMRNELEYDLYTQAWHHFNNLKNIYLST